MPIADPISGRIFIWLIATFLFLSIAVGGSFLILYIVLPQNKSRPWLPVAGVILVCLPWLFWFLTCFYRLISRALGFRVVLGGGNNGGGGGGAARSRSNGFTPAGNTTSEEVSDLESPLGSPSGGEGKKVQFGGTIVLGEENDHNGSHEKKGANKRSLSASNSSNDMSIASHESEMPLTSAMAC